MGHDYVRYRTVTLNQDVTLSQNPEAQRKPMPEEIIINNMLIIHLPRPRDAIHVKIGRLRPLLADDDEELPCAGDSPQGIHAAPGKICMMYAWA